MTDDYAEVGIIAAMPRKKLCRAGLKETSRDRISPGSDSA